MMVSKGNHPQMALIQVSELLQFAICYSPAAWKPLAGWKPQDEPPSLSDYLPFTTEAPGKKKQRMKRVVDELSSGKLSYHIGNP